jgi:hypothetical protein
MHRVLNSLGALVKSGRRLAPGDMLEGYDILLREVTAPPSFRDHVGYAIWFNGGTSFQLLQVLWPDEAGRFPGAPGVDDFVVRLQPTPD